MSYPGAPGVTFAKMRYCDRATSAVHADGSTHGTYNSYGFTRPILQLALERNLLGGLLRSMVGTTSTYLTIHDYSGGPTDSSAVEPSGNAVRVPEAQTLLVRDCASGILVGCGGGWDNVLRLALS